MDPRVHDALADLEREGVLSSVQRAAVAQRLAALDAPHAATEAAPSRMPDLAHRQPARPDAARRLSSIVGALGGVLVGVGVLYLMAYNWEQLGRPAKLALTFGTFLGLHAAGWWLAESSGRAPRTGRALSVAGVLAFGAAVFLVAQIYHLTARYPNAVLAWWLLNVPLVLLTSSVALLHVVQALFLTWCFWHTGVMLESGPDPWDVTLPVFSLLAAGLGTLLLAIGALASASRWRRLAPHLQLAGIVLALAAPWSLSFDESMTHGTPLRALHLAPGACALAAALVVLVVTRLRGPTSGAPAGELRAASLAGAFALALAAAVWFEPDRPYVVANVLMLLGILGLIAQGVRVGRTGWINLGMLAFVVLLFSRYFEYLWDRLQGATAFLATGTLLLGAGYLLERTRKRCVLAATTLPGSTEPPTSPASPATGGGGA